jgi:hypothetical protein
MSDESKKWYRMTRPLFNSGFENDEFWAYGQDGFDELLASAIGADVLIYDKKITATPQRVRAIVQQKTSDTYTSSTVRQILCRIGTLHCGQYVRYDGSLWLVSGVPDNNRVYEKAVLWKCNHTLRFLSPLTGEIVEYPIRSENATQYGDGEANKTNMSIGDDKILVYIPYNRETIPIDNGFRFIMDKNRDNPSVYSVTRVDSTSYAVGVEQFDDGLLQWMVLQSQFNEVTDSREEMIADFYQPKDGQENEETGSSGYTLTLKDLDGDFRLTLGEEKSIAVGCVDADGAEVTGFDYRMEYDLADGAAEVVHSGGDVVTLRAATDERFVGAVITVRAVSDTLGSTAELTIRVVEW